MSRRPWMPFYPDDFRLDTLTLEPDETGVYVILLCLAWREGDGSVTGDMGELKNVLQRSIAKFHGLTFNRIVPKLLEKYFYQRDGRWFQKRVEKELRIAEEFSKKQSRIAKERWSNSNKNKDLNDATAMPIQSQLQSHNKEESIGDADASPPKRKKIAYSEEFETRFWKRYAKGSKTDAYKQWQRLSDEDKADACKAIDSYQRARPDPQFWCDSCRYLSKRHWENFISNGTTISPTFDVRKYLA